MNKHICLICSREYKFKAIQELCTNMHKAVEQSRQRLVYNFDAHYLAEDIKTLQITLNTNIKHLENVPNNHLEYYPDKY